MGVGPGQHRRGVECEREAPALAIGILGELEADADPIIRIIHRLEDNLPLAVAGGCSTHCVLPSRGR